MKEEFLEPMGISQRQLADALGVPYQRINEIVNGRPEITGSTALRLAKYWQVSPSPPATRTKWSPHSPLPTPHSCPLTHPADTDIPLPANVKKTLQ
ncbi:HigA family addiction module antitoxin [Microcystis aeruginosa FBCC-A68]|uniref:HigA family addiction module antitoxin n=1 Tax=Microcystis aeruginosa TaxID=1126 RepID=UPI0024B32096|nr:HigA family addiction module antitoxin [Microcystis aeruginosa]